MTSSRGHPIHRGLAGAALVLGALAAASGDALRGSASRPDEITALQLARWIREARPGLRLVDLRDAESFDAFRIPGADRLSLDELQRGPWTPGASVVVYSDGAVAAHRALDILHAAGVRNAWVLRGGVGEWVSTIVSPVLPASPTPEQAATAREIAELSRWFGGVPRIGEAHPTSADSLRAALGRIRRRGC
jgi:rhodanese-related sulfurtransferase